MGERRTCGAPGCGASIQPGLLMCRACWYSVPAPIRTAVNRTWRAYRAAKSPEAALAAIREYRTAHDAAIKAALDARS